MDVPWTTDVSEIGQKQTFHALVCMSALPPKTGHKLAPVECPLSAQKQKYKANCAMIAMANIIAAHQAEPTATKEKPVTDASSSFGLSRRSLLAGLAAAPIATAT